MSEFCSAEIRCNSLNYFTSVIMFTLVEITENWNQDGKIFEWTAPPSGYEWYCARAEQQCQPMTFWKTVEVSIIFNDVAIQRQLFTKHICYTLKILVKHMTYTSFFLFKWGYSAKTTAIIVLKCQRVVTESIWRISKINHICLIVVLCFLQVCNVCMSSAVLHLSCINHLWSRFFFPLQCFYSTLSIYNIYF